jgi:hypothetical protein
LERTLDERYQVVHEAILAGSHAEVQELIDTGMAWRMPGSVGRACMAALQSGAAVLAPEPKRDYYGNVVPSYRDVLDGTTGSVGNAEKQD